MMLPHRSILHLYRLILLLYPGSFREKFSDEIMFDCTVGLADAFRHGRTVFIVREQLADLITNVMIQWCRTGIPAVIAISASCSGLLFGLIALQSFAPTDPVFAPLHLLWLVLLAALVLAAIAVGHHLSREGS